jgi:hypothetical protein
MNTIPYSKIAATIGGAGLTASAVWLNAEHVAASEGWNSPLVVAGVIVTLCAASAPPFAERAAKTGQLFKAVTLWVFFGLAVGFSLSASIARSSGYVAGKIAAAESGNKTAQLAEEAYAAARRSMEAECVKRGPKCRALEDKADEARKALAKAAPIASVDPGSERLAAVLGVDEAKVQLYVPLFLPLGLELGGFIFLAFGLAPRRREEEILAPVLAEEPAAIAAEAVATETQEPATPMQVIAKAAAKAPAAGTKAYYLQRLQRDFAPLAAKVAAGEMSVYAASIAAGLRKAPAKASKWTKADAYLETTPAA